MLEEPADDAHDPYVVRQTLDSGAQTARIADHEVHLHSGARGLVERPRDVDVLQGVQLHLNQAVAVLLLSADLTLDLRQDRRFHDLRSGQDLPVVSAWLVPGRQVIEQLGQVAPDVGIRCQEAHVGVQASRALVVVASADVRVASQTVVVLPHHQDRLAVRLESDDSIRDVDARCAEAVRPPDVRGLVEPGLQLHHGGYLLAVAGRVYQVIHGLRVCGCPVHGHLDGPDLGIETGLAQESLHRRREGLVGVVQEQGAGLTDRVEDGSVLEYLWVIHRVMRKVAQLGLVDVDADDLPQVLHTQHPLHLEHVRLLVQAQLRREHSAVHGIHVRGHFQSHDRGELPLPQLRLDHRQQIVRLVLFQLGVRVPGHTKQLGGVDLHPWEQKVQVRCHHLLERHEDVSIRELKEARRTRADRRLHAGQRGEHVARQPQRDEQVQRQVRDERERVRGVRRLRRHQWVDVVHVLRAEPIAIFLLQVVVVGNHDVVLGESRDDVEERHAFPGLEVMDDRVALVDLRLWASAVHAETDDPCPYLLLESPNPLHEELVEVRADDRHEFQPLEQWHPFVLGFRQDPVVEVEPRELAVQVQIGILKVERSVRAGHRDGNGVRACGSRIGSRLRHLVTDIRLRQDATEWGSLRCVDVEIHHRKLDSLFLRRGRLRRRLAPRQRRPQVIRKADALRPF